MYSAKRTRKIFIDRGKCQKQLLNIFCLSLLIAIDCTKSELGNLIYSFFKLADENALHLTKKALKNIRFFCLDEQAC